MGIAKVVSLYVRPQQVSHLCFETAGILGDLSTELGATVNAFDFGAFHRELGLLPTNPGNGRLRFNFAEIEMSVASHRLASLRAEGIKAALNKAVNGRQNSYFAKHVNAPAVISKMREYYSLSAPGTKSQRIEVLRSVAQQQADALRAAYNADGRLGVVKSTTTNSKSKVTTDANLGIIKTKTPILDAGWGDTAEQRQTTNSTSSTLGEQNTENTDYSYRTPFFEHVAQFQRAEISLMDEYFEQFMFSQNLPHLEQVFWNELNSIDCDVFQLQIAFFNTFLLSPISGIVTGIYKQLGDVVSAGETVMRIENGAVMLLMATLIHRGPIALGSDVKIDTALYSLPTMSATLKATVVAVRGQDEDDRWEVILKFENIDNTGKAILPLGYHFDYDNTKVLIP